MWRAYLLAFLVRGGLFISGFADQLAFRVELVSPTTNFGRLIECIFHLEHGNDPYAGGVCNQSPLMITLFHGIIWSNVLSWLFFVIIDILCAWLIFQIIQFHSTSPYTGSPPMLGKTKKSALFLAKASNAFLECFHLGHLSVGIQDSTGFAAQYIFQNLSQIASVIYLFLPHSVATCCSKSLVLVTTFCILISIWAAQRQILAISSMALAFLTFFDLHYAVLVIPLSLIHSRSRSRNATLSHMLYTISYIFCAVLLYALSHFIIWSWGLPGDRFLTQTVWMPLTVPDLTPNIGVFWYFFAEVFTQYRAFFTFVFQYHTLMYVIPLTLAFRHRPMFLACVLISIIAIFKSYPVVGDTILFLCLFLMHRDLFGHLQYAAFSLVILTGVSIIAPILYDSWIFHGSANVNFFYFCTIIWGILQGWFVIDFISAALRCDIETIQRHAKTE